MELNDDQAIRFINTVTDKLSHLQPSQKTKEMFENIDKKQEDMKNVISEVKTDVKVIISMIDSMKQLETERWKNHEKIQFERDIAISKEMGEKAGKEEVAYVRSDVSTLKKTIWGIGGAVVMAVIYAVLKNVLK